jgi:DNA-binding response OmpR family regulator
MIVFYRRHNDCGKQIVSERSQEQKGQVLIIEDERSVADALKIILEDNGYRVSVAVTGRDGIEEALRGRFCLTITDIGLSDMSGFDVIKAICGRKLQMHFIIITSNDSQHLMAEARRCGAAGVLLKPFLPSEILELIGTTLANPQRSGDEEILR